ncbi:NADH-quinone oxidoreductase subunit NuoF family protein [Streptomyces acidiscabies]|uniref:NADH-ubiquinone oxidoreductase-F iron-sulfur binding region domain-containing protein n=1 Tax=Streptomyces acidiscabies TaxID=42234 RepID=A0AAP6BDX8_9ACTN|nr:NADH-quinone oxidoreductase subunit NuoF family protein [Streptomyces acidiscabies]MBP5939675.1 oxidoreductase [Streptomyces sp. LBUM 1476]MBZ3910848.1 ferredoxin [Streptomyces acidiscabies]MDX2962970.1 NADH-ubiquinone oxidoreductase-F iron-sulfur binding region domain-containing protein [Streptomyces acidiscabies]MDX3017484.1 NADH-ubiquinone oxidoreductase-F iron-sulfur binding region domain-containing protein [Streptomyces acidiscabies]MDX3787960.1 NADH-ubiquinone oxidoreductase-F iron-su
MNEALPDVPEVRVVGLPQLTSGFDLVERLDLPMHLKVHGPLEPIGGEKLAQLAERINLKGRGGAGFPFHKKLRSVADAAIKKGIRPVVVINGSEDEPACRKDTVMINRAPHLILDGALLCAEALGARTLVVGVTRESTQRSMEAALAERGLSDSRRSALRAFVQRNPIRMVTGAAASLVRSIDGGPAIPPGRKTSASQNGVGGAPTLLSNAETFAQLAIAARIGPERYGNTGLYDEPGTVMLTVSGAVARPMVIEVPTGVPLRYVLQLAGAPPVPQGVLTGGYHGKWIDAATVNEAVVSRNSLDAVGGALGAGAILPISQETCPLGESLRVAQWLADESAGQCGPCYLGLPAAARGMEDILNGGGPAALEALKQVARNVKRRGACSHPDGSAMFLESTIKAFTDDLAAHVLGNGCGRPVEGVLPLFEDGHMPAGITSGAPAEDASGSRQKIFVDWTLCRGHGLCADILPEVFQLGADGFPTVAQAKVPRYAEAKALRAVRRCPALALRIEEDTRGQAPAKNLPVLSNREGGGGRGRRALGR